MADSHDSKSRREREFDRIVHRYYQAIERGETPTRQEIIAANPDFANELRSFFADLRHLENASSQSPSNRGTTIGAPRGTTNTGNDVKPRTSQFIRDYQLLKKLGEGGMGTVYLAVHTQLEKRVAIKVLKGDRETDATAIERFRREIRAVGRFEHEHIVRALDAGKIKGLYFLVMEFIDGADLSQLLDRCRPLAIADACELARQAALGLEHAHQLGLVHRDVKPSNFMLTGSGQVKLLDLGLAQLRQPYRQNTALTVDGQAVGTWRYMAPEQLKDCRSVDATCDIYSLGVTLFELLHGECPATGMQAGIDCSSLLESRRDVPHELIELIRSMTSVQPSLRTQRAIEVADRLASWTDGHDLVALFQRYRQQNGQRPIPPPAPPSQPIHAAQRTGSDADGGSWNRKRVIKTSIFASLFLVAVALSWFFRFWTQPIENPPKLLPEEATVIVEIDPSAGTNGVLEFTKDLTNVSSGEVYPLVPGSNRVPPGDYQIGLDAWTSESRHRLSFSLEPSQQRRLIVRPPEFDFPVQYPKIPRQPGAWVKYGAEIVPADVGQPQSYDVILRCLESETVDGAEFRWIQTEVSNSEYRETAWLLVDAGLYENEQKLFIEKGFIEADVPAVVPRFSPLPERRLAVRWSDEVDPLQELAEKWRFEWPRARVSTPSLLTMIFDLPHRAVDQGFSDMRRSLGANTVLSIKESNVITSLGPVPSWTIVGSADDPSSTQPKVKFKIQRAIDSEEVPFSFLDVDMYGLDLSVHLRQRNGGSDGSVRSVDSDRLASAADRLDELDPPEAQDFTLASLPSEEGEFARYKGTVQWGATPELAVELAVEVVVRAGKSELVDRRVCRWIELAVSSGDARTSERITEKVALLVDELAYQDQREFVIERGWHELGGETFDFNGGDAESAEDSIAWLKDSPAPVRFRVHQVLTLLFDAQLPSSGLVRNLRILIAGSIVEDEAERKPKPWVFGDIPAREPIEGFQVEVKPTHEHGLDYTIGWSQHVPFGFVSVSLALPGHIEVQTTLNEFGTGHDQLLGSHEELSQRATATTKKLEEMGVRMWVIDDNETRIVGIYESYFDGQVTLRTRDSAGNDAPQEVSFADLVGADQEWILATQSREWRSRTGRSIRGLFDHLEKNKVFILRDDLRREFILVDELLDQDRIDVERRVRQLR